MYSNNSECNFDSKIGLMYLKLKLMKIKYTKEYLKQNKSI